MKKYMDKFRQNIHINKNLFVFLLVIVIVGVAAGSIFSIIIDSSDKNLVSNFLNDFFNNVYSKKLNFNNSFINALIFTVLFGFLIWILGLSVIGFFVILVMLFLKAFILGFSVSSIIINFKLKGVLYSLIYIFPHQVINVLVFMILSGYALIISFKIIRCFTLKKTLDFRNILNRYVRVLIISIIFLILTSLYEAYVMPKLLNILLSFFK